MTHDVVAEVGVGGQKEETKAIRWVEGYSRTCGRCGGCKGGSVSDAGVEFRGQR